MVQEVVRPMFNHEGNVDEDELHRLADGLRISLIYYDAVKIGGWSAFMAGKGEKRDLDMDKS